MTTLEIVNAIDSGKTLEVISNVFCKPSICNVYKSKVSDVYFFKIKGNKTSDSVVKKELQRRIDGIISDIITGYDIIIKELN